MTQLPAAGTLLYLDQAASPQFKARPIMFRVIRPQDWGPTACDGWVWVEGYELDDAGAAVERRSVYIELAAVNPYVGARGVKP